jgi:hypothetical protein
MISSLRVTNYASGLVRFRRKTSGRIPRKRDREYTSPRWEKFETAIPKFEQFGNLRALDPAATWPTEDTYEWYKPNVGSLFVQRSMRNKCYTTSYQKCFINPSEYLVLDLMPKQKRFEANNGG